MLGEGRLRGYSEPLWLYVCWEEGMLRFFDPLTESYLDTHEEKRAGRLALEAHVADWKKNCADRAANNRTATTAQSLLPIPSETRCKGIG